MYLESITINNYRKFGTQDNTIRFVKPKEIETRNDKAPPESIISPSTTLIIGKNNSGKTTVVNALTILCENKQPTASDFNLTYLNTLFKRYKQAYIDDSETHFAELETPQLSFTLRIKVDFRTKDEMSTLAGFIPINQTDNTVPVTVNVEAKIALTEETAYKEAVRDIFIQAKLVANETDEADKTEETDDSQLFQQFYALLSKDTTAIEIEDKLFKTEFMNIERETVARFSLKKLINIKTIKANRHLKEGVLSDVFNKIVAFEFTNDEASRDSLDTGIKSINETISENVGAKSSDISQVLGELENTDRIDLNLTGNVNYDNILKGLIKYNFRDGEDYIPEDQFGLGYINLLNIIGEIIHFVDSYEGKSHLSCINLLFIEEPEAFMHPQMQEFFIKRIDNATARALKIANQNSAERKVLQCQITITTHSSHIVNSKIHSSNTFNNLNYLTSINKCTKAINLTDDAVIAGGEEQDKQDLNFIKKHIKYKVSELFFSDSIIFVEGITEETLLNYYLEHHPTLSQRYISVFNINGAHGKLYIPLVKKLCVPSLIITDLDIKREAHEKSEPKEPGKTDARSAEGEQETDQEPTSGYLQITSLTGRTTTNATLIALNQTLNSVAKEEANKLDNIDYFKDENICVVFQKDSIENQHATSLEESLILTNYENNLLNSVLDECIPGVYRSIVGNEDKESCEEKRQENRKKLIKHSYKLQRKLSKSKSTFSNRLLYKLITMEQEDGTPALPEYIKHGLDWLSDKLKANDNTHLEKVVDKSSSKEATQDDAE